MRNVETALRYQLKLKQRAIEHLLVQANYVLGELEGWQSLLMADAFEEGRGAGWGYARALLGVRDAEV